MTRDLDFESLPIGAPVPLQKSHDLSAFSSGAPELDEWLKRFAWANHSAGNGRVFVAARGTRVIAYYTLSSSGVAKEDAPTSLTKGGPPAEIPCILLGRMAVDVSEQGKHLGQSMMIDALLRIVRVSSEAGVRALLIHARDENARSWYLHLARSFQPSPSDPMHLFLPIKELRRIARVTEGGH